MTSHPDEYPVSAVRLFELTEHWQELLKILEESRATCQTLEPASAVVAALEVGITATQLMLSQLRALLAASVPLLESESN